MNLKSHMIMSTISFTKDSPKVSKKIYTKGLDRESRDTLGFLRVTIQQMHILATITLVTIFNLTE